MTSRFMVHILRPEHHWYLISEGAQAGPYGDFHPTPFFPPTELTLPLLLTLILCSMTKIGGIETLLCIGEIKRAFVLLKALDLMEWRGLWKTRTAPFHARGCSCQTWLVHKIGLFITSSFEAWMRKFGKSSNWKSGVWKWQGGCWGITISMALWAKTSQTICPPEAPLLERNSQRHLQKLGCEKREGDECAEKLYILWTPFMWGGWVCRETLRDYPWGVWS